MKQNNNLWFGAKKYGWGWTPIAWQGWLILLMYLVYTVWRGSSLGPKLEQDQTQVWRFLEEILVPTLILIGTCYIKGEKPRWRWGK